MSLRDIQRDIERLFRLLRNQNSAGPSVQSYKVYSALISQSAVNAPTATILENTLDTTVTFQRTRAGLYTIIFGNAILSEVNHTVVQGSGNQSTLSSLWVYFNSGTELLFETYDLGNTSTTIPMADNLLINQFIEIRVYN